MLNWLRSLVSVARRSPCVSAPSDSKRLATVEANRRSPARSEIKNMYSGAFTWFDRWVRPDNTNTLFNIIFYPSTKNTAGNRRVKLVPSKSFPAGLIGSQISRNRQTDILVLTYAFNKKTVILIYLNRQTSNIEIFHFKFSDFHYNNIKVC